MHRGWMTLIGLKCIQLSHSKGIIYGISVKWLEMLCSEVHSCYKHSFWIAYARSNIFSSKNTNIKIHITSPLTYICNKSLLSGIFPFQLKFSEIKPLHKKGDRMDIKNFGPISLLTPFSKILGKVIYTRLYQHINQNNILANKKYGFRNNSSTEKASFKLINEILLALNNKKINSWWNILWLRKSIWLRKSWYTIVQIW